MVSDTIDLELIAQRILQLTDIALREHLEQLMGSQAVGLLELAEDAQECV